MKHSSSVITMELLQNNYTNVKMFKYYLLSLACWLRGKSSIPLLNDKVKVVSIFVKKYMDLKNCGSKLFGSRHFPPSKHIWNECNTIVLTGVRIKPPKNIRYVSIVYNSFLKSPIQMKFCLVIIFIQVHISDFEEI